MTSCSLILPQQNGIYIYNFMQKKDFDLLLAVAYTEAHLQRHHGRQRPCQRHRRHPLLHPRQLLSCHLVLQGGSLRTATTGYLLGDVPVPLCTRYGGAPTFRLPPLFGALEMGTLSMGVTASSSRSQRRELAPQPLQHPPTHSQ
jgi:hypothetical protein